MSYRVANSDTTLSSVTGWDTVTNTPTLHASTNLTTLTTQSYSAAYTAPNTTNAATGGAVMMSSNGSYSSGDTTLTLTLQEYNGATWADTAATSTITTNTTSKAFTVGSWIYFRFGSAYTFTTTSAGYYRLKIVRGTVTNAPTLRMDSGGSNFAFMATDNRLGAIASTDDLLVLGINYATTAVTWDGTQSIGSGLGALTQQTSSFTLSCALYIGAYGVVTADTVADVTTTCKGHLITAWGSTFNIGSSGTPYPEARQFTWQFNPTTTGDFGFRTYNGNLNFYGYPKSSTTTWQTVYSSGVGTAADPLIVSDSVDWVVGDEIVVLASSNNATNYNEIEYRFIKTKNSATSYVLSSTVGGAESALVYTHTSARIANIKRNILFTTTNSTKSSYALFSNAAVTNSPNNGTMIFNWMSFSTFGYSSTPTGAEGVSFDATSTFSLDYCVIRNSRYCGLWGQNNKKIVTINGLIIIGNATATYCLYGQSLGNKTFNDLWCIDNTNQGISSYGSTNIFNRAIVNGCRKSASTGVGGVSLTLTTATTFNDSEINACGVGVWASNTASEIVFNDCLIGTNGYNALCDIGLSNIYLTCLFNNCTFGSTTFIPSDVTRNYMTLVAGSELRFHKKQTTDNLHFWYSSYGGAYATGAGLADTLVRTPGSLNVKIAPEDSTYGFSWVFLVPANINQVCSFSGFFLKNVAMGTDVCTVSLFLPGNPITGTPDATATLSDNVSNAWTGSAVQAVSLSAYYTGTVDGFAAVVINAKSTTAGAYLYCADFYNSGDSSTLYDRLAGLTIWEKGKPSPIITQLSLGGIAPAVWGVSMNGLTTTGTTGKKLKDSLTTGKFLALK